MIYRGYKINLSREDGYWHWSVDLDASASIGSNSEHGHPGFSGKEQKRDAIRSAKATIQMMEKRGF